MLQFPINQTFPEKRGENEVKGLIKKPPNGFEIWVDP
jgi:hypothetical protein